MRRLPLLLGIATCLGSWLAWRYGAVILSQGTVALPLPIPEDGKVANGTYVSDYFDLSYPLPEGWTEGVPGPNPSDTSYYVLGNLVPKSELSATILIAAQDMFFAAKSDSNIAEMVSDFRQAMSGVEGMTIDREPTVVKVADRLFHQLDFSGVGLYRAMFATEIRCHVVSFNLTTNDPELLTRLALSLDNLSTAGKRNSGGSVPLCMKNYAVAENLLRRVEPTVVGPKFTPIPVRIIVGTDGGVKHVHVIHATADQRYSIEAALRGWKLKPYEINGRAVEVETGLVFEFTSAER